MSLPPILPASVGGASNESPEGRVPSAGASDVNPPRVVASPYAKRRSVFNLIVGGPEDAKAIEEFDESPQWLVDDIMEHKRNNLIQGLKRMKRRIVVAEQKEEVPKYKYAETTVNSPLGPEQFPDTLVNLRAELSRGKTDIAVAVDSVDLESPMDDLVGRTPEMKAAINHLQKKAELLRRKHQRMLAVSTSATALPPSAQRYLDRRNEMLNSPKTECPLFRSSRTVPRARRDVDRSFSPNRRSRSPSPDKSVESDAKSVLSRGNKSSPKPARSATLARSRSPPSRPGRATGTGAPRPGSPASGASAPPRSAEVTSRAEKESAKKALAVLVLGFVYISHARAAVQADIDNRKYNTASLVISRFMRRFVRSKRPGLGIIVPPPIRRVLMKYRRKKAAVRLRCFLADCLKNQKGKAIRRFLYRIRKIQKCLRNWMNMNKARFLLCSLYWDKIELAFRKRLAMEHQAAKKAQEEDDKRIKKRRTTQITADKWARKKEAVTSLLRKVDRLQDSREQLKKEESVASVSRSSTPSKASGRGKKDETVLYLGEFEGRVAEDKKMEIIRQTVKNKIRMSMEKEAMDQLAAAEASIKRLLNEDSARSALLEPESFKKLLQVQMLGAKKVQIKQKDGQGQIAANRRGNWDCFLLGTTLGPTMRKVIETSVLNDIMEKRAEAERLQLEEANQGSHRVDGLPGRPAMRGTRGSTSQLDDTRRKVSSTSVVSSGRASPPLIGEVEGAEDKPSSAVASFSGGAVLVLSRANSGVRSVSPQLPTTGAGVSNPKRSGATS